ncbi:hypothetical protein CPB85DRAFT_1440109 [Mucidula mucida]|nr:hypothetical protein CPB85DRAFT_1440109 [Mucidula mucida]
MNPNLPELPGLGAKRKKSAKPNNVPYAHRPHAIIDDQISADGRRHIVAKKTRLSAQELGQETLMEDTTTLSRADQADNFSYLLGEDFSDFINTSTGTDDVGGDELIQVHVYKQYPSLDNPMKVWLPFQDKFLQQLLRLDGTAGADVLCPCCGDGTQARKGMYWCCDNACFGLGLVCSKCCAEFHRTQPFHFIEHWNGTYFEPATLAEIGLTVQLGHLGGHLCPSPHVTTNSFTVVHTNGVHCVNLHFCGCTTADSDYYAQLLQSSLYPATPQQPQTAVSFDLLRLMHSLNCTGKLPAWDLWKLLETMTEERTHVAPPNWYKVLLRAICQWRFLQMCKEGGRGHNATGIPGTPKGQLATQCPACPHPGVNLDNSWRTSRKRLFLATDANFRLRNAIVLTNERDPPLLNGMAYFVDRALYASHIRNYVSQEGKSQMLSCSGFSAMFLADLKKAKGLRTTGVTGVTCSRHGIWRSNGIGDLQRGERYCNVDTTFASAVGEDDMLKIVVSYDIACQWGVNLMSRLPELPESFQTHLSEESIIFCVPKFHLWAHQSQCHVLYLFNFKPGVGRTHGETIEENWSVSNCAAMQTKMMGPGAHEDTLNDGIGRVFAARLIEAIKEACIHRKEFTDFNVVRLLGEECIQVWLAAILAWERNPKESCPYEARLQNKETLTDVQLQMAQDEHASLVRATGFTHESSMSSFLILGLDIEQSQRALAWEVKARRSGTAYQELNIQKQRTVITKCIKKFCGLQLGIFMPQLREYLTPEQLKHLDAPKKLTAEETKLFLPSELKASQNPTTRAEGLQRKIQVGITLSKLRYRWARNALFRLRGHGVWENELKILDNTDVQGMNERMLTDEEARAAEDLQNRGLINEFIPGPSSINAVVSKGKGRRRPSWIWASYAENMATDDSSNPVTQEAIKIEWCKARARMLRWEEEIELLLEEMRRVAVYGNWKAAWWRARANAHPNASVALREGITGFATRAAIWEEARVHEVEEKWQPLIKMGKELVEGIPITNVLEYELEEDEIEEEDIENDVD